MSPIVLAIGSLAMFQSAKAVGPESGRPYNAAGYVLLWIGFASLVNSMTGGKL